MAAYSSLGMIVEARDEEREESVRPNFAALAALLALLLIWYALSPIWVPCLSWLYSLLEPVLAFLGYVLLACVVLLLLVVFGFALAAVAMVLGGGIPPSYHS